MSNDELGTYRYQKSTLQLIKKNMLDDIIVCPAALNPLN